MTKIYSSFVCGLCLRFQPQSSQHLGSFLQDESLNVSFVMLIWVNFGKHFSMGGWLLLEPIL